MLMQSSGFRTSTPEVIWVLDRSPTESTCRIDGWVGLMAVLHKPKHRPNGYCVLCVGLVEFGCRPSGALPNGIHNS